MVLSMEQGIVHEMRLKSPFFEAVRDGRKTVEMRLWDEKRRKIKAGDRIVFSHQEKPSPSFGVRVQEVSVYPSFLELAKAFEPAALGFPAYTPEQIAHEMRGIYGQEQEARNGVAAIEIQIL
ncbi:MAG: ASCH domain-containing protein [Clostridia bacterium]|nr:ASCH domain-containing protein [Clostridia bacterium]